VDGAQGAGPGGVDAAAAAATRNRAAARSRAAASARDERRRAMKSMKNKKQYQQRKNAAFRIKLEEAKGQLEEANEAAKDDRKEWERLDKQHKKVAADLRESANKAMKLLNQRTERWTNYKEKRDAELYMVRRKARLRIEALERKHRSDMDRMLKEESSRNYREERKLSKANLKMKSAIEDTKLEASKKLEKVNCDYEKRLLHERLVHEIYTHSSFLDYYLFPTCIVSLMIV